MSENTNTKLTVEAWAEITIKKWVDMAAALKINEKSPLNAERFVHHVVTNANGDPEKIQFMYDYWLNFVDWGVGKGVTLETRDTLIGALATTRRPKKWFTKVFYVEVKKLSEIVAKKYALKAANVVINSTKYDVAGND